MSKMYDLKPIITLPEVMGYSSAMYSLKNLITNENFKSDLGKTSISTTKQQEVDPTLKKLDERQKKILQQLSLLKDQVTKLHSIVKQPSNLNKATCLVEDSNEEPVNIEIVAYVNPAFPPNALLALKKLWTDVNFNVRCHKHSSITSANTADLDVKFNGSSSGAAKYTVDLTLIWKKVPHFQFMTQVYDFPFEGEVNFLRYLSRRIKSYNYENTPESLAIDSTLDTVSKLLFAEGAKLVNNIISLLQSRLDKNPWLLNCKNPTIVDIAAWSSIKQVTKDKVPGEIKSWYDICEKKFL